VSRYPKKVVTITSEKSERIPEHGPVLIISASDSSCAAGMQVDIRTAEALRMPARCVLTASTAQTDGGVTSVAPVPIENIEASIEAALSDPPGIGAVKIGMLFNEEIVRVVSAMISTVAKEDIPVVLDPVMRSTAGSALIQENGMRALLESLLTSVTLVTPNLDELEALAQTAGYTGSSLEDKVNALLRKGPGAVLVTDGEGDGKDCEDILYHGTEKNVFRHPRVSGSTPRGTGCALSTAIAVNLAYEKPIAEAVGLGIEFTLSLIEHSRMVGNQRLLFPASSRK
jgi:hydroxymethylpyrimidine/phosphomethylpyrimidine kinase